MFSEKEFEDIICKYPELIEEGLILTGHQLTLYGRRMDILFEDKFKRKLIIELKIGPIKDEHIGQILSYEGMILSADDPTIRVMLVGNRVPPNIQKSLDHHGIAWKEISIFRLKEFLLSRGDKEFLKPFEEETSIQQGKNFAQHEKIVQPKLTSSDIDITANGLISSIRQGTVPVTYHIEKLSENGRRLFKLLHKQIISIGPGISAVSNRDAIAYKTSKNFCHLHLARVPREDKNLRIRQENITIHLDTFGKQLIVEDNLIPRYKRKGRRAEISIRSEEEIEKAIKLIRQCYFKI